VKERILGPAAGKRSSRPLLLTAADLSRPKEGPVPERFKAFIARQAGFILAAGLVPALWFGVPGVASAGDAARPGGLESPGVTAATREFPQGFVTLRDGRFQHGGRELHVLASSCYPYWKHRGRVMHGGAWADPDFPEYIAQIQDMALAAGVNALRVTDILDGVKGDWRDPVVWSNFDLFLKQAQARGLYVILTASVYRKWLIKRDRWPYDPKDWKDFLAFFGAHTRDARNILYIGIAGELPPPTAKDPKDDGTRVWKATAAQYTAFFRECLDQLGQADPNHLLCVGGLSFLNRPQYGVPWRELFSLPGNSLAAIHVYSEGDLKISLPLVADWARARRMPWVLEEFGAKQGLGDAPRAGHFRTIFREGESRGAAAVGFWNLGPELAAGSYEVGPQCPLVFQAVREQAAKIQGH